MKNLLLVLLFLLSFKSFATIYLTAFDRASGTIALVYSSSGGNFWQHLVKNKGLIGEQASGLCPAAKPKELLSRGLSAKDIGDELVRQCDADSYGRYRLSIITIDGEMDSKIGSSGCHQGNHFCGNKLGPDFMITGGGLEKDVIAKASRYFESQTKLNIPFSCKLYKTLSEIYKIGGEKKDFRGISITMDNLAWKKIVHWSYRRTLSESEDVLLKQIDKQMKEDNIDCSQ